MQPEWRALGESGDVGKWSREIHDGDWSSLKFPGQNGLLGVLAMLAWWGIAAKTRGIDQVNEWSAAVRDVE